MKTECTIKTQVLEYRSRFSFTFLQLPTDPQQNLYILCQLSSSERVCKDAPCLTKMHYLFELYFDNTVK